MTTDKALPEVRSGLRESRRRAADRGVEARVDSRRQVPSNPFQTPPQINILPLCDAAAQETADEGEGHPPHRPLLEALGDPDD